MQLYANMQLISRVYELRNFLFMFYDLRLYASFENHSDLTIVFRSIDYVRSASFTAFHKRIIYLIYFSLPKNENDLQFSMNLRLITFDKHQMIIIIRKLIKFCILQIRLFLNLSMIKVLYRSSKSELSKNWTIVTGELTSLDPTKIELNLNIKIISGTI